MFIPVMLLYGGQQEHVVSREGRTTQPDGFLVEWQEENVDTARGPVSFVWDAMNTPAGLAGYIRYHFSDSCTKLKIVIYPRVNDAGTAWIMSFDTLPGEEEFYAFDKSVDDGDTTVIAEWVLPWSAITDAVSGTYSVGIHAFTECGDTLDLLKLSGKQSVKKERIINNKIILQLVTIFILFVLFYLLKARLKKGNRK